VQTNLDVLGNQAWYGQMLLVDSSDPTRDTVYLGGQLSSVKTTDGGQTWSVISTWLQSFAPNLPYIHADFHTASMLKTPVNTAAIIFGTDGGLFASGDGGQSWFHGLNKGLTAALINFINGSPLPHLAGILAVGLQDEGSKLRFNSSSVLWNTVLGGDGDGCAFNQVPTTIPSLNLLVTSVYYNQFFCLNVTGPGRTDLIYEDYCSVGINQSDSRIFFSNLVTPEIGSDPTGFVFYTFTEQTVYRSEYNSTIILLWKGIGTNGVSSGLSDSLFRLTLHGIGMGNMNQIAVCKQDTVALTTNGGISWFEPNITDWFPSWSYTTSPLWVTLEGVLLLFVSSESVASTVPRPGTIPAPRVIFTADLGVTWSSVSEGLPNVPVSKLVFSRGKIYAATWLGVFVNDLTLAPWKKLGNNDLPSASITDLYISSNLLYAGSYGRGAWQFDTSIIPPVSESSIPTIRPITSPSLAPVIKPTSSSGSSNNSNDSQLSDGAIAGIVIGSVVFGMCVAGLIALLLFSGSKSSTSSAASTLIAPVAVTEPASASAPAVNPEAGLNSSFSIGQDEP